MMNVNVVWRDLIKHILVCGEDSSPRGKKTKEAICNTSRINMNHPILLINERNVSYKFMFAEAWWILSGRNDVESIKPYAPSIEKFSDDGRTFRGAYGPRVIQQVDYCVETLINDLHSRQSVMTIWDRNPRGSKDIPCTLSLQFILRGNDNDELHCVATMRSSDIWIGWIYDVFNFSCISACIALEINRRAFAGDKKIKLGTLHLTAGSQHLYEDNFDKARKIATGPVSATMSPISFSDIIKACDSMDDIIKVLKECKDREYETN